ncbi:hypothetical protein [Amycolatopsis sp. NPDC051372]|uniref:hypothetical protein n=1 Tax=unclassified Amycolatopsis TaxID=2618356 RepID=UPI00342BCBFC
MTLPDHSSGQFDADRRTYPPGDHVTGVVTLIPRPGAIGLVVDLGGPPQGFVDVLHLPRDPAAWPPVGTVTDFEVLWHRPGQVRLWPLNAAYHHPAAWTAGTESRSTRRSRAVIRSVPR